MEDYLTNPELPGPKVSKPRKDGLVEVLFPNGVGLVCSPERAKREVALYYQSGSKSPDYHQGMKASTGVYRSS